MNGLYGFVSSIFGRQVAETTGSTGGSGGGSSSGAPAQASPEAGQRTGRRLISSPGTLYLEQQGVYRSLCEVGSATIAIEEVDAAACDYVLHILDTGSGAYHLSQDLADGFTLEYKRATASLHWVTLVEDSLQSFAFRLGTAAEMRAFVNMYNMCVYASMTKQPVGGIDPEDEDYSYVASAMSAEVAADVEGADVVSGGADGPKPTAYRNYGGVDASARDDDGDAVFAFDDREASRVGNGGGVNCCFADSICFNRAIVLKTDAKNQCVVQAFSYNERGAFKTSGAEGFTLKGLGASAPPIAAKELLLEGGERVGLLLNKNDPQRVLEVDFERGCIVQEYQPGLDFAVHSVVPQQKFADRDPNLYVCLGDSSAFTIDRRLDPKKCAVVEDGKDLTEYAQKLRSTQRFSCHATSQEGHLAIGDLCGQIRLFTGPPGARKLVGKAGHFPKAAKTLLKCAPNNPIRHIDITANGAYVLATCDKFLLVLCTLYMEAGDKMANGFASRMGKNKPAPLRLSLDPRQTVALGGVDKVTFTKATFQQCENGEQWIVAACGPMLATWNFAAVREAIDNHYSTACVLKNERNVLKSVEMRGTQQAITFMTDTEVGREIRSSDSSSSSSSRRSGKTTLRFQQQY